MQGDCTQWSSYGPEQRKYTWAHSNTWTAAYIIIICVVAGKWFLHCHWEHTNVQDPTSLCFIALITLCIMQQSLLSFRFHHYTAITFPCVINLWATICLQTLFLLVLTCIGEAASGWTLCRRETESGTLSDCINYLTRKNKNLNELIRLRLIFALKETWHFIDTRGSVCCGVEGWTLTFSKEYWQLAMTRQNWKTQMSLKKPWRRSRNPRKATRLASTTANTFSPTRRFLRQRQSHS